MFARFFVIFIFLMLLFANSVEANNLSFKDKIRLLFTPKTTQAKPLQVKTIPSGAVCKPDMPSECNVKK